MMEIENNTPFALTVLPGLDRAGGETVSLILQGTYRISGLRSVQVHPAQPDPALENEWISAPYKPGTDVLMFGHAHGPKGSDTRTVQVCLSVGPVHKRAGVRHGSPLDKFAVLPRTAKPRRAFAGTYDQRWQRERAPLLPEDFDERFFQAAFPELIAVPHLRGDEQLTADNVSAQGTIDLGLPAAHLEVEALLHRGHNQGPAPLDTVILEPDEERLTLVWRRRLSCPDGVQAVRRFRIWAA